MFKMWIMPSIASQRCFKPFWAYSSRGGYFFVHRQPVDLPTTKKLKGMTDSPTNVLESWSFHLYRFWCSMPAFFRDLIQPQHPQTQKEFQQGCGKIIWKLEVVHSRAPGKEIKSTSLREEKPSYFPADLGSLLAKRAAGIKVCIDFGILTLQWSRECRVPWKGFPQPFTVFRTLCAVKSWHTGSEPPKKTSCPRQRTQGFSCLRHG